MQWVLQYGDLQIQTYEKSVFLPIATVFFFISSGRLSRMLKIPSSSFMKCVAARSHIHLQYHFLTLLCMHLTLFKYSVIRA